jgi:hypothetical protein
MLVKMEPMGGRKPSQLLAAMMEFCPTGMEKTLPFHYYFTQRFPPALRTQLGEVEHGDPRALAARADKLWTMHPPAGAIVAAVEPAEPAVAAIRGSGWGTGNRGRGGTQRGRGASKLGPAQAAAGASASGGVPAADPAPAPLLWLRCLLVFAFSIGISPTVPRSARAHAVGETSCLGTP